MGTQDEDAMAMLEDVVNNMGWDDPANDPDADPRDQMGIPRVEDGRLLNRSRAG